MRLFRTIPGLENAEFARLGGLHRNTFIQSPILLDATLVRSILVPTFMRVAGGANWWAPAWLQRIHRRIGIREG